MKINNSYRALYDKACLELQDDSNKKELIELLRSWRKEDADTLARLEKEVEE